MDSSESGGSRTSSKGTFGGEDSPNLPSQIGKSLADGSTDPDLAESSDSDDDDRDSELVVPTEDESSKLGDKKEKMAAVWLKILEKLKEAEELMKNELGSLEDEDKDSPRAPSPTSLGDSGSRGPPPALPTREDKPSAAVDPRRAPRGRRMTRSQQVRKYQSMYVRPAPPNRQSFRTGQSAAAIVKAAASISIPLKEELGFAVPSEYRQALLRLKASMLLVEEGTEQLQKKEEASRGRTRSVVMSMRDRVLQEIVASERAYVQQLKALMDNYYLPLQEPTFLSTMGVNPSHVSTIFNNFRTILAYHTQMLFFLESIPDETEAASMKPPEGDVQCASKTELANSIGAIMLRMIPLFEAYCDYVRKYDDAVVCLEQCLEKKYFREFITAVQRTLAKHRVDQTDFDLVSLLIVPVQRIPRYILLLRELLKYTPISHFDYVPTQKAHEEMASLAKRINECNKSSSGSNLRKIAEIAKDLSGEYLNLVETHRRFIREGNLVALWEPTPVVYRFFLFNDMLLYAAPKPEAKKAKYKYKGFFLLYDAKIADVVEADSFDLLYTGSHYYSGTRRYLIKCTAGEDKREWMQAIQSQIVSAEDSKNLSQNDLFKEARKDGFLFKRGGDVKSWRRRFFRLKGKTLFYYMGIKDSKPRGHIPLPEFSLHLAESRMRKVFCFELRHPTRRCWYLQADSKQEVAKWLAALLECVSMTDEQIISKYLAPATPLAQEIELPPIEVEVPSSSGIRTRKVSTAPMRIPAPRPGADRNRERKETNGRWDRTEAKMSALKSPRTRIGTGGARVKDSRGRDKIIKVEDRPNTRGDGGEPKKPLASGSSRVKSVAQMGE